MEFQVGFRDLGFEVQKTGHPFTGSCMGHVGSTGICGAVKIKVPFLGTLNIEGHLIVGIQKETMFLTTYPIGFGTSGVVHIGMFVVLRGHVRKDSLHLETPRYRNTGLACL